MTVHLPPEPPDRSAAGPAWRRGLPLVLTVLCALSVAGGCASLRSVVDGAKSAVHVSAPTVTAPADNPIGPAKADGATKTTGAAKPSGTTAAAKAKGATKTKGTDRPAETTKATEAARTQVAAQTEATAKDSATACRWGWLCRFGGAKTAVTAKDTQTAKATATDKATGTGKPPALALAPAPAQAPGQAQAAPKTASPDLPAPPEPQWRTTGEVLGLNPPAQEPIPVGQGRAAFTPFSQGLADLRREVALICGSARLNKQKDSLAPLVTDLFLSNVDPAFATEALILGDCGSLAAVVREMVAQGGNTVVSAVVNRALFLSGPGAEAIIRAAASSGLNQDLASPGQHAEPTAAAGSLAYSMAYFPSRGAESGVESAPGMKTLYSNATPGYGVYTFVLLGAGFDPAKDADHARYAELLRVIETYVLAGEQGAHGPRAEAHAFLVAIRPDREEDKLIEQTGPALSAAMRKDLTQYLGQRNEAALAKRLETLPGPFLISSLEPRLLPTSQVAPRLVTDLSGIGPEYLYAVVDAYDRPIPPEQQDRPEGLGAIRERLLGLFSRKVVDEDLSPTLKDAWVFRLGTPASPKPGDTIAGATAPKPDVTEPNPGVTEPKSGKTEPKSAKTEPKPGKTTPKPGKTEPKSAKTAPKSGKTEPKSGKTAPKSAKTAPKSGKTEPKSAKTAPKPGKTAPKPGKTASPVKHGAATRSQPAASTPPARQGAPKKADRRP